MASGTLKYKIVTKKNKQYMIWPSITLKIIIKDYTSRYVPKPGQESTFAEVINNVLNSSKEDIIRSITAGIEQAVSVRVLEVANKICKSFTYDELLPDRE